MTEIFQIHLLLCGEIKARISSLILFFIYVCRNLHCRYSLIVSRSVVALDLNSFDVDGLRCDNLLLCFPRPLTKDATDCPYDRVKVYDGPTEDSPLIVTLCGKEQKKFFILLIMNILLYPV